MATTLALQPITSDDDFKKILDVSLVCFLFSITSSRYILRQSDKKEFQQVRQHAW